ncbi:ABC transporter permease [Jiangella alkaliphila]|uniref:ABC-2 type transport system permease protein n=1 Tax=Jiangella alkaliphila TaxID=419479 RepID=A0A1H2L7V5_9ACTN|nr:ABC transporter permease [Jiangella alkaliphila]SDU76648.1 ABC-2 type transport system permease protein [Jiangella alkaliphila]
MSTATTLPTQARSSSRSRSTLAGTWTLTRFMLRRDRVRLPVWIAALTLFGVGTVGSFEQTYPTAADRATAADLSSLPAVTAMVGRIYSRDDYTYGVMTGHQMYVFMAILLGLMSILLFVRHTRAEEETGRAELVRSNVLGRHAQLTAAFLVVGGANAVTGLLIAAGLSGSGADGVSGEGSLLFGVGLVAAGLVFTAVAAVTSQITEYARGASGMALAVLGVTYAIRAVGDVAASGLSWVSPLYWGQATRSFAADQRWWPLLLMVALTVLLATVAYTLSVHRDVGAGLRPARLGSPTASPALSGPLGLAFRLQRASLIAWSIGLLVLAVTYGSLVDSIQGMFDQISSFEDLIRDIAGATLIESWLVTVLSLTGMLASIQAVLAVLRLRAEETAGRAEPILATAVSRGRWAASHLTMAFGGSAVSMVLAGLGFGVSTAIATDDTAWIGDMLAAGLVQLPAIWVAAGFAMAVVGLAPRLSPLTWLVPAYAIAIVYMGQILQFPDWTRNLSPFGHVPELPAGDFEPVPVLILLTIAAAFSWAGLAGMRRRDIPIN